MLTKSREEKYNATLTGTTLRVYKCLVKAGKPIGPRALQRSLNLSSPSVALFHLEKLMRNGLAVKTRDVLTGEEGLYAPDEIYLRHFVLFRRMLIPKYLFYAAFSTFSFGGWIYFFSSAYGKIFNDPMSSLIVLLFLYGLSINVVILILLWFETWSVSNKETI